MLKRYLNYFIKFFRSICWYEVNNKRKIVNIKNENYKLVVLKSKKNISDKKLDEYFKKYKFKLARLNKKNYFMALTNKQKILSSGWIYFGSKWKITEIDKDVYLDSKLLLFDFETPTYLRNRGYYTLLLKMIRNKFLNKKLAIYSLSNNVPSCNAIEKSGFKFIKEISGLRN